MKKLSFAMLAILMMSCGSDSNNGGGTNLKPVVEPIQAAQTLTKEQVIQLANEYAANNTHVVYVGETSSEKGVEPFINYDDSGETKQCVESYNLKKVVYSVTDTNIEIYVEKESETECGDEVSGSFERFIEVHNTDEYYDMNLSDDDFANLQNVVFKKGTYKGQPVISVRSTGVQQDVKFDSYSISALNRSMLTSEMLLRVSYSYGGQTFFNESQSEMRDDTDISTIDTNGVIRRYISYED